MADDDRSTMADATHVDSSVDDPTDAPAASVRSLADQLDCEVDATRSEDSEGITYMAPVRSGIMTDAVVRRLHGNESLHVFYRAGDRGPLTNDDLSHGFTHRPAESHPGSSLLTECSPWLVIGPNYVVQVGSDIAAKDVRSALPSFDEVRVETTTRTPSASLF